MNYYASTSNQGPETGGAEEKYVIYVISIISYGDIISCGRTGTGKMSEAGMEHFSVQKQMRRSHCF